MPIKAQNIIAPLLEWYGRHKRVLPWRGTQDAYKVWLSEIMLQQTTVPAVAPYFEKFLRHYPDVRALAAAPAEDVMRDWAGLGYYSRARNLHACAKTVAREMGGHFPQTVAGLKALPGIGEYTAGAIAAIAFGQQASVVDGNVERVITRLYAIETPLPDSKPEIRKHAQSIYHDAANISPSDLPQAFMDLGAMICVPKNPKCPICPVAKVCDARRKGIQNELPRRLAKAARPRRKGFVYWITDKKGRVLLQRRPDKGLLGGMAGLPTSEWSDAPAHLKGFKIGKIEKAKVKHVFTHFELSLQIVHATITKIPDGYYFSDLKNAGLPSVFTKAVRLMRL
jgi:A/G-specific adenine glycosylase